MRIGKIALTDVNTDALDDFDEIITREVGDELWILRSDYCRVVNGECVYWLPDYLLADDAPTGYLIPDVDIDVNDLKVHASYLRTIGPLDPAFVESIKEVGVLNPLHVTNELVVLDGVRRLCAAKELGLSVVPCYF